MDLPNGKRIINKKNEIIEIFTLLFLNKKNKLNSIMKTKFKVIVATKGYKNKEHIRRDLEKRIDLSKKLPLKILENQITEKRTNILAL